MTDNCSVDNVRKSKRATKGQIPARYRDCESEGDEEPSGRPVTTSTPYPNLTAPTSKKGYVKSHSSRKLKSKGSVTSVTSAESRKREAEWNLEKTIAEAEEAAAQRRLQLQLKEAEAERFFKAEKNPLEVQQLEARLARLKTVEEKKLAMTFAKIDEENDWEYMSDTDESQRSGLEEVKLKKSDDDFKVKKWLHGQEDKAHQSDSTPPVTPPATTKHVTTTTNKDIAEFAQAIALALKNAIPPQIEHSSTDRMDKFLVRQTMGKDLPHFHGKPEEWPGFIDEFKRSTKMCHFSSGENLNRLRKCLIDKAKDTVAAMLVAPENVDEIIETLRLNFGNPQNIIESLVEKAKKTESPREDKLESIIIYSNAIQNLVKTIESLKRPSYLVNPILMKEFCDKLPGNLQREWGGIIAKHESTDKEVSLKDFSNWIVGVAKVINLIHTSSPSAVISATTTKKTEKKPASGKIRSERTLSTTNETTPEVSTKRKESTKQKCSFCNKIGHMIDKCFSFSKETGDKRWNWARENKVCFSCLKSGHAMSKCNDRKMCGKDGCQRQHHQFLHNTKSLQTSETQRSVEDVHHTGLHVELEKSVLLRISPVMLRGPAGTLSTYALLDASTVTLVESSMAKKLGVSGQQQQIKLQWTNSIVRTVNTEVVQLHISGVDEEDEFLLTDVCTRKNLDLPMQSVNLKNLAKTWNHLKKGQAVSMLNAEPTILIGQDNVDLMLPRKIIEGSGFGPVLTWTKLGWVVHGKVGKFKGRVDVDYALHISRYEDGDLHRMVKESFSTEGFGVMTLPTLPQSRDDSRARAIMENTIRRIECGWETGLLWKSDSVKLPESKSNALSRLHGIEKKMDRDPDFALQYCNKIQEYLDKGYVRKLTPEETRQTNEKTWYLPLFGVTNLNKPGKFRLVFDAAAKSHGMRLNDALLSGPDKLTPLVSVLLKFRQKRVGFSGDIRDMLHRIKVRKEDRMAQRFLWRGMDRNQEPDSYEMLVMTFGATCSSCLAQEVKNRNALEFEKKSPDAVEAIIHRTYVYDYVDSTDDEKLAILRIQDVIYIHNQADFEIASWVSSSKIVLEQVSKIPAKSTLLTIKCLNLDSTQLPTERVLGLFWNPNEDCFNFELRFHKVKKDIADGSKRPTKREVLQLVASIFDPLGLIADFTVKAKILLQDIWRTEIGWDDFVTDSIYQKWKFWLEELRRIPKRAISRCYSSSWTRKSTQIHIFCDASEHAFFSVSYLRIDTGGSVDVSLIMAKTRVAPLKPLSIPRLELQAAVMGSRLSRTILDTLEFKIDCVIFWTDSSTVLRWLRSDARSYKPFVSHRIGEILELTDLQRWRWIPSEENVADEATRDSRKTDFQPNSRWLNGPPFLKLTEKNWPQERQDRIQNEEDFSDQEMKHITLLLMTSGQCGNLPDVNRFSSYVKLIRTTAWVPKLWNIWRTKKQSRKLDELTPVEVHSAEILWWKEVQAECFQEDVESLSKGRGLPNSSKLKTLTPYLDSDGVLRVRGRTEHAPELTEDTKFPVILDPKHQFTRLLLMHYHLKFQHNGQETVTNEVRQKYWVMNLRSSVRSTWNSCLKCRIDRAKPKPPMMGSIPEFRLTRQDRPFMITGIDYFGPMTIQIGRRHEKRYGALFTCMNTCAVHVEMAHSLTTDSCIMAIRRFIARRGSPKQLYSDNGTNFRGADAELKRALVEIDQEKITQEMTTRGIEWHFIPPYAPNFGGCWERLVKSIKTALQATLKERVMKEETLLTLIAEAEFSVNCHPLTHVSVDPNDNESLTPNHFLLGLSSGSLSPGEFRQRDLCLRKQWRIAQCLADHFWKRWVKEYLPSLTRREKWHQPTKQIAIGDLVLIADGDMERNSWPRGIVIATFPGKDGIVRVADIDTSKGTFRRPVTKLCILDIAQPEEKGTVPLLGGSMCSSHHLGQTKANNYPEDERAKHNVEPGEKRERERLVGV